MNTEYKVIWASVAENDLVNIIENIAEGSPQNAIKILAKIRKQASALCSFPERGRIVPELYGQGILVYRELMISPWRLMYRVAEKEIYVLSLIDSRRNVEDILLKRLITM